MSSEAALWKWLRARLPRSGHYSRIESETSPGFPDVNYCIGGIEGNIELKCSRCPKAKYPFKKGGLRKSQEHWIRQRIESGGRVFLLAQVGKERFLIEWFDILDLSNLTLYDLRSFNRMSIVKDNLVQCLTQK